MPAAKWGRFQHLLSRAVKSYPLSDSYLKEAYPPPLPASKSKYKHFSHVFSNLTCLPCAPCYVEFIHFELCLTLKILNYIINHTCVSLSPLTVTALAFQVAGSPLSFKFSTCCLYWYSNKSLPPSLLPPPVTCIWYSNKPSTSLNLELDFASLKFMD